MIDHNFTLEGLTIAVNNMEAMVKFYNSIFRSDLRPIDIGDGLKMYKGSFLGLSILLCPNSLAGVKAEQNRQQFKITVDNIESFFTKVESIGDYIKDKPNSFNGIKACVLIDPDGNTIEINEKV